MRRKVASSGESAPALFLVALSICILMLGTVGSATPTSAHTAANAPSVSILFPTPGLMLNSSSVELSIDVQNLTLNGSAIGGPDRPGEGHYDVLVDGGRVAVGWSERENLTRLPEGMHRLEVVLAENNGAPLQPRVNASVWFEVTAGAPSLALITPLDGQHLNSSSPVVLVSPPPAIFRLEHGSIGKPNAPGVGHIRAYVDGELSRSTGHVRFPIAGQAAGNHSLRVELVSNDGSQLSPPVRDISHFTVLPGAPMLRIASPHDGGENFTTTLDLRLRVDRFDIDPANGSIALLVDGLKVGSLHTDRIIVNRLMPGVHAISVALQRPDGSPLPTPVEDFAEWTVFAGSPSVTLASPTREESIASSSPLVRAEVKNFPLGAGGRLLAWLDGKKWANSSEAEFHLTRVPPGTHELVVALSSDGETNLSPLVAEPVRFTVPEGAPFIALKQPSAKTVVIASSSLAIEAELRSFKIDPAAVGKSPVPGVGHIEAYVPGIAPQHIRSEKSAITRLEPGTHVIELQLANNDDTNLSPEAKDVVSVTVPPGSPYLRLSTSVKRHVITASVEVRNFALGPSAGRVNYIVDGYLYRGTSETTLIIDNLTKGQHVVRAELAAGDGSPSQPAVVDEVYVGTGIDPPKERQDPLLYLAALGIGAAMMGATIAMAVHGIPRARRLIVEMTEEQEQKMTGRRPVRGVR